MFSAEAAGWRLVASQHDMFAKGKRDMFASCEHDRFDYVEYDMFDCVKRDRWLLPNMGEFNGWCSRIPTVLWSKGDGKCSDRGTVASPNAECRMQNAELSAAAGRNGRQEQ